MDARKSRFHSADRMMTWTAFGRLYTADGWSEERQLFVFYAPLNYSQTEAFAAAQDCQRSMGGQMISGRETVTGIGAQYPSYRPTAHNSWGNRIA